MVLFPYFLYVPGYLLRIHSASRIDESFREFRHQMRDSAGTDSGHFSPYYQGYGAALLSKSVGICEQSAGRIYEALGRKIAVLFCSGAVAVHQKSVGNREEYYHFFIVPD